MEKELDSKEFTEPFDLERWKNGETVIDFDEDDDGNAEISEFIYIMESDTDFTYQIIGIENVVSKERMSFNKKRFFSESNSCRMRPASPAEDGWIKWDGSVICPIPWARAGEYEVKFPDGSEFVTKGFFFRHAALLNLRIGSFMKPTD